MLRQTDHEGKTHTVFSAEPQSVELVLPEPEYEGRGIGPGGQNRQNRADTGGKRRNRPCAVRRRMAAVQP